MMGRDTHRPHSPNQYAYTASVSDKPGRQSAPPAGYEPSRDTTNRWITDPRYPAAWARVGSESEQAWAGGVRSESEQAWAQASDPEQAWAQTSLRRGVGTGSTTVGRRRKSERGPQSGRAPESGRSGSSAGVGSTVKAQARRASGPQWAQARSEPRPSSGSPKPPGTGVTRINAQVNICRWHHRHIH